MLRLLVQTLFRFHKIIKKAQKMGDGIRRCHKNADFACMLYVTINVRNRNNREDFQGKTDRVALYGAAHIFFVWSLLWQVQRMGQALSEAER
ncbi:MAG: hypothetical protein ACLVK8_00445 [Ruminococcus sp.]